MYEQLRAEIAARVVAAAQEYHRDYRATREEAMLYALGAAHVVIADLARETMAQAADSGDSAARLSAAYAAGQEMTIKGRNTPDTLAEFAVVRPRTVDPLGTAAGTTAGLDQTTAELRDEIRGWDLSSDDES